MSAVVTPFGRTVASLDMNSCFSRKLAPFSASRTVSLALSAGIMLAYCGKFFCANSLTGMSSSACAARELGDTAGEPAVTGPS
jgi:hypothetical protein